MRYSLKALGRQGVVQLQIDAEDADQARRQVEDQGLRVLSLRGHGSALRGMAWRREASFDLVLFSQELSTLLNAGLPLIDALESLAEKAPQPQRAKCSPNWSANCTKAARCPKPWANSHGCSRRYTWRWCSPASVPARSATPSPAT